MAYNRGTQVELSGTFKDAAGALADPTGVTLEVKNPAGTLTTYTYAAVELTRASLGVFTKDVVLDTSGTWYYRFQGDEPTVAGWLSITVIDDPLG